MPEKCGRDDHAGVIAAAKNFQIGTAGQGCSNLNDQFALFSLWHRNVLNSDIFAAVKDGSLHGGAAVMNGGFDGGTAVMQSAFNGGAAVMECVLDRSLTVFNRCLYGGATSLDGCSDGGSNALDYIFYAAGHSVPPTLPLNPRPAQS